MSSGKNHRRKNPVSRVMNTFNKPKTERDRTRYTRKAKYRNSYDFE